MKAENQSTKSIGNISIASLITSLELVCNNLHEHQQKILKNLDQVVLNYIQNRNSTKLLNLRVNPSYQKSDHIQHCNMDGQNTNQHHFTNVQKKIDYLSIEGLQALHGQSQLKILQLQKQMANFHKNRDLMYENNNRVIKDINQSNQFSSIFQLCKEVIIELSKYKDIQQFSHRLIETKKKLGNIPTNQEFMREIQTYVKNMTNYFTDSQSDRQELYCDQDQFECSYKSLSQTKQKQNSDDKNQVIANTKYNSQQHFKNANTWSATNLHSKSNAILQLIQ